MGVLNCEDPPRTVPVLCEHIVSFCRILQHGWLPHPVDTTVCSLSLALKNWQMDISLAFSFKTVHRRLVRVNAPPARKHVHDSLLLKQLLDDHTSPSADTIHYWNGEIS
jgi:hypothetical protein